MYIRRIIIFIVLLCIILFGCKTISFPDRAARERLDKIETEWADFEKKLKDLETIFSDARQFLEELKAAGEFPNAVDAIKAVQGSLQKAEKNQEEIDSKMKEFQVQYDKNIENIQVQYDIIIRGLNKMVEDAEKRIDVFIIGFDEKMKYQIEGAENKFSVNLTGLKEEIRQFKSEMTLIQKTNITGLNKELNDLETSLTTLVVGYVTRLQAMEEKVDKLKQVLRDAGKEFEKVGY